MPLVTRMVLAVMETFYKLNDKQAVIEEETLVWTSSLKKVGAHLRHV